MAGADLENMLGTIHHTQVSVGGQPHKYYIIIMMARRGQCQRRVWKTFCWKINQALEKTRAVQKQLLAIHYFECCLAAVKRNFAGQLIEDKTIQTPRRRDESRKSGICNKVVATKCTERKI